ncbi:STAS domain-containing protein [Amycolatopsis acidiphila]|uniref:Anti-sigma factor antagonist n=1 Tax=Amycolatopsis acidiphila TaxID=715473 RepID=A0A557ZZR4_9PSEU|nr:STAS domain-containing protein [Amycolatopsis acidiphila]TVT17481.1 STAS domain-containing protein [Amycolatopsis acidiphila]UIJ62197.1 STAS domain-containing protein [Amycolatopsis acidiphila]GHG92521.1 anti-sigma factor antagonist [Amycolatopsis acidiphila]
MHTSNDVRIDAEHRHDGILLARTAGEVDALGAPCLRNFLGAQVAADQQFVLDLDQVTFLGSAGMQVLLDADDDAARRRLRWALVGSTRAVTRPLQLTGLAARLPLQPTVPAALTVLSAPQPVP